MTFLVPLVLAGLAATASRWPSRQGTRESLLRAVLAFGAVVVVATEGLSLADAVTAGSIALIWVALAILTWSAAWLARTRGHGLPVRGSTSTREPWPRLVAAGCALILAGTFLVAVLAPPSYIDAMSYHMARVLHWIQGSSVDYYPSGNDRQNYQPPFAEFVILHVQLLSGGDRWANLVQWSAFALSGMTVSLVLADIRQAPWVQWAGALVAFTTPMAIVQASGAQNDLVVSLWLLAFLLYLRRVLEVPSWEAAVLCGIALGLALVTKGTAYLYAPAMGGVILAFHLTRGAGRRLSATGHVLTIAIVAVILNLGPWSRNLSVYGKLICCEEGYFVERLTARDAVSNVVRNSALHLAFPGLKGIVVRVATFLSPADVDDPRTTFGDTRFGVAFSLDEGRAGNHLLFLLAAAAAVAIGIDRSLRRGPAAIWIVAAVVGFLAFSLPLKWQPWGSRLHVPVFLILTVPVAVVLGSWSRRVAGTVLAILFAGSLVFVVRNEDRPLVPARSPSFLTRSRFEQYFVSRPDWEVPYREAAAFVRRTGEPEVGLLLAANDFEYPLWILLKDNPTDPPLVRHVGVSRGLVHAGRPSPPPVTVVTSYTSQRQRIDGYDYVRVRDFGPLSVLRRARPAAPETVSRGPRRRGRLPHPVIRIR